VNHELESMRKEAVVARFDVIHRLLYGGNEEIRKHLPAYRICGLGFEHGTPVYWASGDAG
jgi:hypothetical protein